ncbi:MAG: tRNA uridine-5-carboxymethylaminomethyl(34) synthesis GTPase MnmE [Candidatus Saccharicenans sp.]|jgi:tRNA modification GTPase|nr:tRNA uridine-5-carboxymethylaminomethyl(34) synthesis GTPase MnmE [Candidatus Saccharicenans sp.]MDH7492365.1 tRNA uridine-5-carboxymethylaminomethyl(34) synthesis GTPase MnmE [Candidatus Saccharicenans sp.]
MNQSLEDTIIAVSTPPGPGGIGIVRLSGPEALPIARKIFALKETDPAACPRAMCFGYLHDPESGEVLDAGYLCYFPAPNSYTREEVVELNLHGSPVLLAEAVRLGIKAGARLAHPGEFTLRAYLNGRIDIIQAEAINDLIQACSLDQARVSFKQMEGSLSCKIASIREKVVELLSLVETSLEFAQEEPEVAPERIKEALAELISDLERLVTSYQQGRAMLEGLSVAVLGKTNVGKSTLFNALLEEERAIVTPYPGTTRDFIRENILLDGVLIKLVDMAGFGQAQHPVEEEGMVRGQRLAEKADGLLLVLDASRKETREDFQLLEKFSQKKMVLVFNKVDLEPKINIEKILAVCPGRPWVEVSALTGKNLEELKKLMLSTFSPPAEKQEEIILHQRQKTLIESMKQDLERALRLLEEGHSEELVAEAIREVLPDIGQLTGEISSQEILEEIFNRFCIGK